MPAPPAQPDLALHESAFLALLRTCSALTNDTERFLRTHGLSLATYQLIRSLRDAGSKGKTSSQLGEDMVSLVPDVTRLVDRMQRAGLVERARDRSDGRVVRVAITRKGVSLLERVNPSLTRLREQQLGGLSTPDLAELTRMLHLVREHARATHAQPDQPPALKARPQAPAQAARPKARRSGPSAPPPPRA